MQIHVAVVTKKLYLVCAGRNCVLNYTHHSLLIVKVLFINILDINRGTETASPLRCLPGSVVGPLIDRSDINLSICFC